MTLKHGMKLKGLRFIKVYSARGFQHRPRHQVNVNARKKHVLSLLFHKSIEKVDFRAVFRCIILALFCFDIFKSAREDNFNLYPRSRVICKQLLNHGEKLARIHHVVAGFTKCSCCLPSILIVNNCIFLRFGGRLECVAHRFARCPFRFSFRRQTQEIPMARKWMTKAVHQQLARTRIA